MKLSSILQKITTEYQIKQGEDLIKQAEIQDVAIDSRLVEEKSDAIFFALEGADTNGEKFIPSAIKQGAKVIIAKKFFENDAKGVIFLITNDPFNFLVETLQVFYQNLPQNIYAVTGTNGKTSTVEFTRQIFELMGVKAASIGTLGLVCDHIIENGFVDSSLTTPDIVGLYKNLSILKKNGVDHVAIEASSIGLDQKRMAGIEIKNAAFTNFSQDHLDYHDNMEEYFAAKNILFKGVLPDSSKVTLNSDIEEFSVLKGICEAKNHQIIDYGKNGALKIENVIEKDHGQEIEISYQDENYKFFININVNFQVFNLVCALGLILNDLGLSKQKLEELFEKFDQLESAAGRMQKIANHKGAQIFIDYAHTPDALEISLKNARKLSPKRLIVLFGCGGDRDQLKRPQMCDAACQNADLVIVTDDNPRTEDPAKIRSEIMANCDLKKAVEVPGRKDAIEKSLQMLKKGDIIILAGKGHEKYQSINGQKIDFDEVRIVKKFITNKGR